MTVLLLEDEYPAAERLQRLLLQAAPEAQVLAVLDTVAGALAWLATNPAPTLILSDMQLADGLSLEIWEQAVVPSPVIFTTAFDAYAIRAFQAHSVAYLLKPVKLAELQAAITKLHAQRAAVLNEELRTVGRREPMRHEELGMPSDNSSFLIPHSSLSVAFGYGVNRGRQPVVAGRHGTARVVGAQAKFDHVVLVAEPRMMVEPLGFGGHVGEEGEGRAEVSEPEGAGEAVINN